MENDKFKEWLEGKINYLQKRIEMVEEIAPDHRNIVYFKVEINCYKDILSKYKGYGKVD